MGKIRKPVTPHSDLTVSPALKQFVEACTSLPLRRLPRHLESFPSQWPFPRGDLFNWIPVLNRFDDVLKKFVQAYGLHEGPQSQTFGCKVLLEGAETFEGLQDAQADSAAPSIDGDRELVEHILDFSRVLYENCANRRLYASSQHIDAILNTTSTSLLNAALRLALRLAQKYAHDRIRNGNPPGRDGLFLTSISHSTLAAQYQISLDKLHKLSLPFHQTLGSPEKRTTQIKETQQGTHVTPTFFTDLSALLHDDLSSVSRLDMFGQPYFSLWVGDTDARSGSSTAGEQSGDPHPAELRLNTSSTSEASHSPSRKGRYELIEVPSSKLQALPLHEIVKEYMPKFPKVCQYEFLSRLRVAKSLCGDRQDRAAAIQSRLLAVANYLNIFPENQHHQKIFQADGEDIRRAKLSTQLCEILQGSPKSPDPQLQHLQSLALTVLEGYTNHAKKTAEVTAALGANVNHGVLTYIVRKAVNGLAEDDTSMFMGDREWSKALFSLLHNFPRVNPRAGEGIAATGILESFVEALRMRTSSAENAFSQILTFLDVFVYNTRDAFTAMVDAGGLDVISELLRYLVDQAFSVALQGKGVPEEWKSPVVDYRSSFRQQSSLRSLFKLVKNMISIQGGAYDRLLRNLIESSQLLSGLRYVIDFPPVYGSNVWCGAVEIFSNFIHNEPTSYAAIAEAGLTSAFLGTVTSSLDAKESPPTGANQSAPGQNIARTQSPPPTLEAISTIPLAFSAICLNENGMRQFQEFQVLEKFFADLLKPAYLRALIDALQDQRARRLDVEGLGAAFDELARHHPSLKPAIIAQFGSMLDVVHADVTNLRHRHKLRSPTSHEAGSGPASDLRPLAPASEHNVDVEMQDADGTTGSAPAAGAHGQADLGRMKVVSEIFAGFFANTSFCTLFTEANGIERLVDVLCAPVYPLESPVQTLQPGFGRVMSTFILQKPHLVVPLLLERLQKALELSTPFTTVDQSASYFADYIRIAADSVPTGQAALQCLSALSTVRNILSVLTPPFLELGGRNSPNPMHSINIADILANTVSKLVSVQKSCIWENAFLQNDVPAQFVDNATATGTALDAVQSSESRRDNAIQSIQTNESQASANNSNISDRTQAQSGVHETAKQNYFKLGALLKNLPHEISYFLHSIGRSLALARRLPTDAFQRAKALMVASSIASALVNLLDQPFPVSLSTKISDFARRTLVMTVISAMVDKRSEPASQFLTLIVWYFKRAGGVELLLSVAREFFDHSQSAGYEGADRKINEATWALQGLRTLFAFFMRATSQRSLKEAHQTTALSTRGGERPSEEIDYFTEAQFLVEMRHCALRFARCLWSSDHISKFPRDLVKHMCTVLQYALEASGEQGALRRGNKVPTKGAPRSRKWQPRGGDDSVKMLTDKGFGDGIAREALYRCMGHVSTAQEYCSARRKNESLPRFSIPAEDLGTPSNTPSDGNSTSTGSAAHGEMAEQILNDIGDEEVRREAQELVSRLVESSDGPSVSGTGTSEGTCTPNAASTEGAVSVKPAEEMALLTVDELDELRSLVRDSLVDRCLFVLSSFDNLSFELADLIISSVARAPDPDATKADVSRTLLNSLISYQGSSNLEEASKKIASGAHLLAVVFQDKKFFDNARDDLSDNVDVLTQYLNPSTEAQGSQNLTWMSNVLLIIERMLCEDLQPIPVKLSAQETDDVSAGAPVIELKEPLISSESKQEVFNAISNLLPRVGKDPTLATSCLRVLVALTRDKTLASQMTERRNMQRLFVMIKQLASVKEAKFVSLLLVILRQIVEDTSIIRQTMKNEIESYLAKNSRSTPTISTYLRQLFHLGLRSPQIFVDVTNELLVLSRVHGGGSSGEQSLFLKRTLPPIEQEAHTDIVPRADAIADTSVPEASAEQDTARPSTELKTATNSEAKSVDNRAPHLERADGVTAFLLSELLAYKEIQDKDNIAVPEVTKETDNQGDVQMTDGDSRPSSVNGPNGNARPAGDTQGKPWFKLDDHPVYLYRCVLMQCLTELLQSYTLTKFNFLAFSRKAEPLVAGPIKPRSGVLNYLLHSLIADSATADAEGVASKKNAATCNWAMNVLTALCAQTAEENAATQSESSDPGADHDLAFVRKFVLEHALKAYKDASTPADLGLESKQNRLLNLADLFNRMLTGKPANSPTNHEQHREPRGDVQRQMAKIMFEKNLIPLLTSSVSDLDQRTPGANKVLKCILKTLKTLTHTAIHLSESGNISAPSQQDDEDEIASASSASEFIGNREETPDLFRNSTLGMFEPGRQEETSSDESDDEDAEDNVYGDDYADDMDFDEEGPEHGDDEVISEEDEDDMGHIEGLSGDVPMEVEIDVDEDDEDGDSDEDDEEDDEDDSSGSDERDEHDVEIMEEIEADEDDADSDAEDEDDEDADEWQDEDEEAIDFGDDPNLPHVIDPMPRSGGESPSEQDLDLPIPDPVHVDILNNDEDLEGLPEHLEGDNMHEDPEDQESDEEGHGIDDDEDDYDDEEIVFGRNAFEDDHMDSPPIPWGVRGHHHHAHHHHHRHFHTLLPDMDSMFMPELRSQRPGGPRTPDDTQGVNPLLNRSRRDASQQAPMWPRPPRIGPLGSVPPASFLASLGRSLPDDAFGLDRAALDQIIQTLGQGGAFSISMHGTDVRGHPIHGLRHIVDGGMPRPTPPPNNDREDPFASVSFEPASTKQRWEEIARILFGPDFVAKSNNLVNSLLKILTPPAVEREKLIKAKREEETRKFEEEQAKLKAEREEREAREKKEREEQEAREAAEREAAEAEAARVAADSEARNAENQEDTAASEAMEGIEPTAPTEPTVETGASEAPQRVVTSIRGREVNIAHLGIDTAYLEALPEDLREEVIMQQAAEQRSTQPATQEGQEPSTIDSEFLDALPPDIREEILQQEAQDRRRREREEVRRRARESGAPAQPEEIDPASLIASWDPMLRQQVLADSDEDFLAALPPEIQAEARALGGHRRRGAVPPSLLGNAGGPAFGRVASGRDLSAHARPEAEKRTRPPIVQMLDKTGVAGLLRLLFMPLHTQPKGALSGVLLNVCGNRQTRNEVINGLLSILQDGCADAAAVERCYSQVTLRAKQQAAQKTPQRKASPVPAASDISPTVVMDQSLTALAFLAQAISHIPHFFVTEHDQSGTGKARTNRKGKAKDAKAGRYPFMVLVNLLERDNVINNATNLDQLSALLAQVTQPLNNIAKKGAAEKNHSAGHQEPVEGQFNDRTQASAPAAVDVLGRRSSGQTMETPAVGTAHASVSAEPNHTNGPENGGDPNAEPEPSKSKEEEQKNNRKARTHSAPSIPAEVLKPVINLIMSRECNGKVFQNAIASMTNLAVVEGAREVFKRELIDQARQLASTIQARLASLTEPLKKAESEIDAQSLALSQLSPTGSDQTKFHRILTALDYLSHSEAKAKKADKAQLSRDDRDEHELMSLYEEPSFMSIWNRLSEVLNAIKRSESYFFNVATILLSLIESLMLVCKRVTFVDGGLLRRPTASLIEPKDMRSVFFSFTNQHRKILNDLVRHSPKLMSNNFSVLVKNPGVLEFDNKRNYFTRRLHHRSGDMRHYPHPSLQLHVRRDEVFLDSYKHLHYKNPQEIKYGKFNIRFHNEEGVDAGGVTREWFQVLARQMFNPGYALFNPVASDRTTFHPNSLSSVNPEHLSFFKFIGRIIGKALYENRVLDCHFSRAVYKRILGQAVSIKDMETVDLDYSKNMQWMLSNDITDIITETFSITVDKFGVEEIVDLIPNGRNVSVTEENKEEYVRKMIEYRLTGSVSEQLESFLQGFYDIVPTELISIFDEGELELLISGMPDVDVDDWRANTDYHNYNASSSQIQWFWRAVRSFDKEERARLLQFVTGTGKVPLNGFKELEGMNGFTRFSIHKDYGSHDRLPSSHTCFNQLDLPEYDNYEQLRRSLYTAMTTGNEHFGFA